MGNPTVIDIRKYTAEQKANFFKNYPNAISVGNGKYQIEIKTSMDAAVENISSIINQQRDPVLESQRTNIYQNINKVSGKNIKPEEEKVVTPTGKSMLEQSKGKQAGYVDKKQSDALYIQDFQVTYPDKQQGFISYSQINDPNVNPELYTTTVQSKRKWSDPTVFEPKEVRVDLKDASGNYIGLSESRKEYPFAKDLNEIRTELTELKSKNALPKDIPVWEGASPPEDLVRDIFKDKKIAEDITNYKVDAYDRWRKSHPEGVAKATEIRLEKEKEKINAKYSEVEKLGSYLDAEQIAIKALEKEIISSKEKGLPIDTNKVLQLQDRVKDFQTSAGLYNKKVKDMPDIISDLTNIEEDLYVLGKDYSLLRKSDWLATTTLGDLIYGAGEFGEASANQFGRLFSDDFEDFTFISDVTLERRKRISEEREKFRPDVSFDEAFSNPGNLAQFLLEETSRQLPIFALTVATGGAGSLANLSVRGAAALSGVSMATMSAGQQIGEMTYQEYLSKYNDIQKYGVNLEYNDPKRDELNKYVVGLGVGLTEGAFSALPTYLLSSRFFKNATNTFKKRGMADLLTGDAAKKYYRKEFLKESTLGFLGEAPFEGATQLLQNIITGQEDIWEGVDHATFSGGFFGTTIGGAGVAIGMGARLLMPETKKIEIDNLNKRLIGLRKDLALNISLNNTSTVDALRSQIQEVNSSIEGKIEDFEVQFRNNFSKGAFDAYKSAKKKQSELRVKAKQIYDSDSSNEVKKREIDALAEKFGLQSALIDQFKQSTNKFDLLKINDPKKYNDIREQAVSKLKAEDESFGEGKVDVTEGKINKVAYEIYLGQEIDADTQSANKVLKDVKEKHKGYNFETEKEALEFAKNRIKDTNISKVERDFWNGLIEDGGALNGQAGILDGVYTYISTKESKIKNERAGTATHEVSHLILWDWITDKGLDIDEVAKNIKGYLKETNPQIYSEMFGVVDPTQRVEVDAEGKFIPEEIVVGFLERIGRIDTTKKINQSFLYKIGRLFNDKAKITTDLSTQPAIIDFMVKMGTKIKEGTFSLQDVQEIEKSEIFKELTTKKKAADTGDIKAKPETKKSLSLLEDINNLVPKNVKTKEEFLDRKVFNAVFQSTQPSVEPKNKLEETNVGSFLAKKDPSILKTIGSTKPNEQILKVVKSLIKDESSTVLTQQEIDRAIELVDKDIAEIKNGAIYNYIMSREASSEEKNIMLDRVRERLINYDPAAVRKTKSGEPITFGEFLFANTAFSQRDAKKKLAIDSERIAESLDTEEARQVADEPITETTEDPRIEYQNLVEANVLPAEMVAEMKEKILLVTKTLKSRIDAAVSKNKTVTPLMSEIKKEMGTQADILFKKVLGSKIGDELKNNFLKLKKPILENMTTTWLQGAMPFAIQKSVDGKFINFPDWQGKKIDRETVKTYKAGRTDGKPIVRRLPNAANKIKDPQFLAYMFDNNGDVVRGAKESLSKALAQEYAIDMYNEEFKNPNSEIVKAFEANQTMLGAQLFENYVQEFSRQSERGSVKRSLSSTELSIIGKELPKVKSRIEAQNTGKITPTVLKKMMLDIYSGTGISEEKIIEFATKSANAINKYFSKKESVGESSFENFVTEAVNQSKTKKLITWLGLKFDDIFGSYTAMQDVSSVIQARRAIEQDYNINLVEKKGKEGIELIVKWMKGHNATSSKIGGGRGQYYENVADYYNNNLANIPGVTVIDGKVYYEGELVKASSLPPKAYKTVKNKKVPVTAEEFSNQYDQRKKEADEAFDLLIDFLGFVRKNGSPTLWVSTMKSLDSNMQSILKAAASVEYYFEGKYDGELVYEHMMPTNHVMLLLTQHFWAEKIDLKKLKEVYSVAIVPRAMDKNINLLLQSSMQSDYDMAVDHITSRYYNNITSGMQDIYAMKKLGGKDAGKIFGEGWVKFNSNLRKGAIAEANKNKTRQKALNNAAKRSYSENPKGISVYDFDDTLAFSKSQVIVKKDGKSYMITPAEFAAKGEQLLAEGAEFDFSEFNKVVKGQPGPLIPRIQKAIDKFGNNNIFILTARPVASESAIHAFMKGLGIDIPRANITGLANSTAQAKADWMVGKVAEGFNDFYFVDDAIKNVQAVKDVLETFDVKSKVQQAIANRKRSMSSDLNKMIERNKGVRAETTYSKVLARKQGAKKGKFKFFVPYSAEDFKGLTSYTLAGKGKQGEADQKLFNEALILPYTRGIAAMEGATQALKNDYKNLLDMFGLKKELPKKIGDTDFTTDQAVRVYLWDQQGFDIPNISKRDQNKLTQLVASNPDLVGFAEGLMAVSKKDNWVDPKDHWDVGSILKDLNDITDNVNRKEYLAEFIENVDEMFDKTTLNKLEAIYGTNYVEALQDSIRRMKSGSNTPRSAGKIEQKWLNWVNNSVGTIMFFNRRSALLQMLSFTNFINWSDNNPAKAAAAFANQPLYWKNWVKIFNSDKLKERRGGLKSDIQESEIANQAKNSKDKASAVVSYLLKIGFTPTQIADSFAIATGGATFLINRTKKYEKQGMYKADAEAKAFEDFGRISDETQQSGDPMLISQQQSSHLGRLILAFQNTPMQYTRLMKKAGKDIINRRGSDVENLSKIAYYGFVQNLIFSSLQSALFALLPGFDDEEADDATVEDKAIRTANSMVDTILRGSGLAGAVVSTLKNAIMRYQKEDKKAQERYGQGDQTYTMLELANISPPIGSKLRKVYSAIQTKKFNQAAIDEMGYDLTRGGKLNPSPNYEIIANIASAVGNLPLDRLLSEVKSITEAFDSRNTSYQRIALALGWRTWDVNVRNEEQDLIKAEAKQRKKEASKQRAKEKRDIKSRDKRRKKELEDRKKRELKRIKKLYLN
jgi:hypothetical protein